MCVFTVSHLTPFDGFMKCVKARSNKERKSVCYFLVEERSLALDRVGVLEGGAGGVSEPPRRDLVGCGGGGVTSLLVPLEDVRNCLEGEGWWAAPSPPSAPKQTFLAIGSGDRSGGDRVSERFRPNFLQH